MRENTRREYLRRLRKKYEREKVWRRKKNEK